MGISAVEANNSINLLSIQNSTNTETIKSTGLGEISDDFSESNETQKFKEIVKNYDITNMSRNEATKMYKELYDNKLIKLKDMIVTFDPTRIPGWQDGASSVSGWKISSNPDEKMNFLEGLKIQDDWNKKYGNAEFQHNYDEKLALSEKIKYFQS